MENSIQNVLGEGIPEKKTLYAFFSGLFHKPLHINSLFLYLKKKRSPLNNRIQQLILQKKLRKQKLKALVLKSYYLKKVVVNLKATKI